MSFRFVILAIGLIVASYLAYIRIPYSLSSDIAYQGLAATQYVDHTVAVLHSVRLVNPRDLTKDVQFYLMFWTPFWTFLFVLALKMGLALGTGARLLTFVASLIGGIGWVWITSLLHLKGRWRVAAVTVSALFCLRTGAPFILGTGDLIIYTVAPWLIGASILLGTRIGYGFQWRTAVYTTGLCFALGSVYWLKFSAIFMSIAIAGSLVLELLGSRPRPRVAVMLSVLALYGTAFVLPILGNKWYTYRHAGTDLVESSLGDAPPSRTPERNWKIITETVDHASTVWFSALPGLDHFTGTMPKGAQRLLRIPGLAIFGLLLYLLRGLSSTYIRKLVILLIVIPVVGFPALTYITGIIFVQSLDRCCAPFWIMLEMVLFVLLSQPLKTVTGTHYAKLALALAAGFHLVFFLWFPLSAVRDGRGLRRWPGYEVSSSGLYVPDLSRQGTLKIDAQVRSLMRSPQDVIVPAAYSERTFGIDMWIELGGRLGGRLLPLTVDMAPSMRTHGHEGANYYGTAAFRSSHPLRVILVASNLYGTPNYKYSPGAKPCDFRGCVERIQGRFVQARQWVKGPDTGGHAEIWFADLE